MNLFFSAFVVLGFLGLVFGSSHSEAPGAISRPQTDITDVYLFNSYETGRSGKWTTFIMNVNPLQDRYAGPNYKPLSDSFFYEMYIDSDGDGKEDHTFNFLFSTRLSNANPKGGIQLNIAGKNVSIALAHVGPVGCTSADCTTIDESNLNQIQRYKFRYFDGPSPDDEIENHPHSVGFKSGDRSVKKFGKPYDFAGRKTFGGATDAEGAAMYAKYASKFIYDIDVEGFTINNKKNPSCNRPLRVFVGPRREPFSVNLGRVFDLVNFIPISEAQLQAIGITGAGIRDQDILNVVGEKTITTFAIEVLDSCIRTSKNDIVGGWAAVKRVVHDDKGRHFVGPQVNRLANPLFNELIVGLPQKDKWNRVHPRRDREFKGFATNPTFPEILNILFKDIVNAAIVPNVNAAGVAAFGSFLVNGKFPTIAPTKFPRQDLVNVFLQGFPGLSQPIRDTSDDDDDDDDDSSDSSSSRSSSSSSSDDDDDDYYYDVIRLNVTLNGVRADLQKPLGAFAKDALGNPTPDLGGWPFGRRPGDDIVDIALQAAMGRLCTFGNEAIFGCAPQHAPTGIVDYTDGAPQHALQFDSKFPYFTTPLGGHILTGGVLSDQLLFLGGTVDKFPAITDGSFTISVTAKNFSVHPQGNVTGGFGAAFSVNGVANSPSLTLQVGATYTFTNNAGSTHPFYLSNEPRGTDISTIYKVGLGPVHSGASFTFTPTNDDVGRDIFYACANSAHPNMGARVCVIPNLGLKDTSAFTCNFGTGAVTRKPAF